MAARPNLKADGGRLWSSLMAMAEIGPGIAGGNNRQTLTDEDREARNLFRAWCEAAGATVRIDGMGNMFARRPGSDPALPAILVGSHLDTQPTGGRFDGVLGVLAGLEILRTLQDLGIRTRHPIEVVNWTNEEGARFAPGMIGSGVFAGTATLEQAYASTDAEGLTFGAELKRIGYAGPEQVDQPIAAYFELHIEQGPILEAEGVDIGVVTHAQGHRWFDIAIEGVESHAGSTPMGRRQDALLGAARLVETVNAIALAHGPAGVGTVGVLNAYPGSRNVIPGRVHMTVEFRHPNETDLLSMREEFLAGMREIAENGGLAAEAKDVFTYPPITFDPDCVSAIRGAAERLGYSHRDMISGAGHDACQIAAIAPAAMVFCPCVGGISHNEAENIRPEWAAAGADVLLNAVLDVAGIAEG